MLLAKIEDDLLYVVDKPIYRTFVTLRKRVQGRSSHFLLIGDMQLRDQVAFWHVIDTRDVRERHPGTNGAYITGKHHDPILLKALKSLYSLYRAKDGYS